MEAVIRAVLGKVFKKIEELEYDYSQELLPEEEQKTAPDTIRSIGFNVLYSYGEEHYAELVVPAELFVFLELGGPYLFFFEKLPSFAATVTSFLPAKGGYDWVDSLAASGGLSVEQAQACKALAARERELEKQYHEHVAKGGCPF